MFWGAETGIIVIFGIVVFFSEKHGKLCYFAGSGRQFMIPYCLETGFSRNKIINQFHKLADKAVRLLTIAERNHYNSPLRQYNLNSIFCQYRSII